MAGGRGVVRAAAGGVTTVVGPPVTLDLHFVSLVEASALDARRFDALCATVNAVFREATRFLSFRRASMTRASFTARGTLTLGDQLGSHDPEIVALSRALGRCPPRGLRVGVVRHFVDGGGARVNVGGLALGASRLGLVRPELRRTLLLPVDEALVDARAARSLSHELGHLLIGPYHDDRTFGPEAPHPHTLMYRLAGHCRPYLVPAQLAVVRANARLVASGREPNYEACPAGSVSQDAALPSGGAPT